MKPIATSFTQAVHYFEQGVRSVRCLHGEVIQNCDNAEDAYNFFAQYEKVNPFWYLLAAAAVVWLLIAWAAGSL